MAPTTHIPAAADGSDNESKSNPVPAALPHVGHLKPILIGPGTAVKDSKKEDVPSTELGLLLMDFSIKKMDMHDLDITLLLTSNNALPLLRAFDEKLQGDDDLSKAVDTQLLGNDFSAQDPLNLEKFATHAENFAEKIMLYEKDPVKFERTHSPHQVFLAQYIMHFLNDNSTEGKFFNATVAFFMSETAKLEFSAGVFTHCRLHILCESRAGFYGTLFTKNISRPMDEMLREQWARLYWLPGRHGGLFKARYEPTVHAHGQYMRLKWLDSRETGTSYEADWEKEDQRLAALVSVDGKVMSKEESEAKATELEQEFTERYLQWMRDLEASGNLSQPDAAFLKEAEQVEAELRLGAAILDSRNVGIYDPNDPFLQKSTPVEQSKVLTRFKHYSRMIPFNDHEDRVFTETYRAINDPKANYNGKRKSNKIKEELMGANHWRHIADRLPGRTVVDVTRHYYATKPSEGRSGYREGMPRRAKQKSDRSWHPEPLVANFTPDPTPGVPLTRLDYAAVKSTNRMQALTLVQQHNKMAQMQTEKEQMQAEREQMRIEIMKKNALIASMGDVTALPETRVSDTSKSEDVIASLRSDLKKSQGELKKSRAELEKSQANSIESQRLLHQSDVDKAWLQEQLKTAGDGVIGATLKNISKDKEMKRQKASHEFYPKITDDLALFFQEQVNLKDAEISRLQDRISQSEAARERERSNVVTPAVRGRYVQVPVESVRPWQTVYKWHPVWESDRANATTPTPGRYVRVLDHESLREWHTVFKFYREW